MADYVIALLRENKSDEELRDTVRTHCYEFLRDSASRISARSST